MRAVSVLLTVVLVVGSGGCYRTIYQRLEPPAATPDESVTFRERDSGWQHFFVFGWFPSEKVIDTRKRCGDAQRVKEIRTQQTFAQGLIATFAGYYVNIYSPYTGQVVCEGDAAR